MKRLYLFFISLLAISASFAAPKIKGLVNNGIWKHSTTWDLNRIPVTSDTIIVPANKVLVVDNPQTLGDVYVQVYGTLRFASGKLTIGANSEIVVFPGGVITGNGHSEKIRIGNTEVFNGTDPDVVGPAIANSSTGAGFGNFNLPVKFLGFNVIRDNKDVVLQWATAEEVNADRYEIERSTDATSWSKIASVQAAGSTNATTTYSYTDRNALASIYYYRIKQVDVDGRFMYTPVKLIEQQTNGLVSDIKIISIQGKVVLHFPKKIEGNLVIRYVTLSGQVLDQRILANAFGQVVLTTDGILKGNVIVSISNARDIKIAKQIIL